MRHRESAGQKFCGECGTALAVICGPAAPRMRRARSSAASADRALPAASLPAPPYCGGCPPRATERRLVSVLFADLVGFTTLSESRDAEEVRELLSRYFDTCRRLIELYGGTVEKFIGDAVMAVWGTPTATEDDAERAVRAALDLVAAVSALGDEVGRRELARARGRADRRGRGDARRRPARGWSRATSSTPRRASSRSPSRAPCWSARRRGGRPSRRSSTRTPATFELKGKEGRRRSGRRCASSRARAGSLSRRASRRRSSAATASSARSRISSTSAPRRGRRTWSRSPASPGSASRGWRGSSTSTSTGSPQIVYWHRGRCLAYGEGVTYWALADMVRMRCRIAEDEDPAVGAREAAGGARGAPSRPGGAALRRAAARAAARPRRAGVARPAGPVRRLAAVLRAARRRLPDRARVRGHAVGGRSRCSTSSSTCSSGRATTPLYVITLARPELLERRPTWGAGHRNFTSLYLEPLPEAAMEELLAGLVPGPARARCATQILARAEGVPLYAVETVRMLLDRGAARPGRLRLPARRARSSRSRSRRPCTRWSPPASTGCPPRSGALLQDAAVLGKTFTRAALAALDGRRRRSSIRCSQAWSGRRCSALQADPRSPEHGQYGFLQDLLRQVAYETLPKRERRAQHLAAAEHLDAALGRGGGRRGRRLAPASTPTALDPDADDAERSAGESASALVRRASARRRSALRPRRSATSSRRRSSPATRPQRRTRSSAPARWRGSRAASQRACSLFEEATALYESIGDTHARRTSVEWAGGGAPDPGPLPGGDRADGARLRSDCRGRARRRPGDPSHPARLDSHSSSGTTKRRSNGSSGGSTLPRPCRLPEALVRGWNIKATIASPRRPQEARGLFQLGLETALEYEIHAAASQSTATSPTSACSATGTRNRSIIWTQALALARRIGDRRNEWFALSEMSYALTMLGRWDEALARFARFRRQAGRRQHLESALGPARASIFTAASSTRRGELGRSATTSGRSATCRRAATKPRPRPSGSPRGIRATRSRSPSAPCARHELSGSAARTSSSRLPQALEAALELREGPRPTSSSSSSTSIPSGSVPPLPRARSPIASGPASPANDPAADGRFTAAAAQLRALDLPFHLAVVLLEHGEWLARQATRHGRRTVPSRGARDVRRGSRRRRGSIGSTLALPSGREPEPVTAG